MSAYALLFLISSCSYFVKESYRSEGKTDAVASWYGRDFHGRPTSSGEIFNMYALTCAHKGYPFGTKVKVTNVSNSRSVECVVNDRGPFISGRDIDLSYAAAKEIGLIGPGTAAVWLELNGRDTSYIRKATVRVDGKAGPVAIQVGAFTEHINALRLKAGLEMKYGNVYIQETDINGTTYFRVRVGNFLSLDAALQTASQLGQEGYPAVVMKADVKL